MKPGVFARLDADTLVVPDEKSWRPQALSAGSVVQLMVLSSTGVHHVKWCDCIGREAWGTVERPQWSTCKGPIKFGQRKSVTLSAADQRRERQALGRPERKARDSLAPDDVLATLNDPRTPLRQHVAALARVLA